MEWRKDTAWRICLGGLAVAGILGLALGWVWWIPLETGIVYATQQGPSASVVFKLMTLMKRYDPQEEAGRSISYLNFTLNGAGTSQHRKAERDRHLRVADWLLRQGAPINSPSLGRHGLGLTPLHAAVLTKDPELVHWLRERGADLQTKAGPGPAKGQTPLEFALFLKRKNPSDAVAYDQVIERLAAAVDIQP